MAGGKLIFPVKFDLESAVRAASGDVEKVLRRLETSIAARPLKLDVEIGMAGKDGSINAIRKEMDQIVQEWNQLSEAQRIKNPLSGEFTEYAKGMLKRYAELTAASETYARSLQQIVRESKRASDEELKRVRKARETEAMLKAEETSLTAVAAKMKYYKGIVESSDFGSKEYMEASRQLERLGTQYQRLLGIMNTRTGNQGKDQANFEKLAQSLKGAEKTIDQVQTKLKSLEQLLKMSEPHSAQWKAYADQHARLTGILQEMQAEQREATKTEAQLREERERAARQEMENQRRIKASRAQTNAEVERERQARQTLIAQKRQEIATLNGEERTIEQVNAKLRIRRELLTRLDPSGDAFRRNAEEIIRLSGLLDEYNRKLREATTAPVNIGSIAAMPEKSIADITAKIQAYKNVMQSSDFGSRQFTDAMTAASALTTKLEQMNKTVGEQEKWRVFQEALKASATTMEGLNTLLSAWQSRIQGLEIGSAKWKEAAENVARYALEVQRATQYAQDFQQKAFQGLSSSILQRQVEQTRQLRAEIQNCDEALNRLHSAGMDKDKSGNFTPQAIKWIQEKATYTKMLAEVTFDADKALQKYEESERKAAEASKKRADALKKMRDAINANEQRLTGLNEKLQFYQNLIQKQQVGSDAWNRSALEIRRLSAELERVNQIFTDFQQKSFKGVSGWLVEEQVRKLQMLRAEIQTIDSTLHANRQMTLSGRGPTISSDDEQRLLDQRIAKTKQINEILRSASDLQLERERKINEETEKRKKLLEDMRRKEKEHDAAKGERRALAIAEQRRKAAGKLTKEQKAQQRMLDAQENTVNAIQKKLEHYRAKLNGQVIDSAGFRKTAAEIDRLTKALEMAQRKIDALTGKTVDGSGKQERAYNRVSEAMRRQTTYIERLVQRMAIYASFNAMGNFLARVREVTAQFELQRVSLGAIIQDQNRADQLFSEIKQFALKSPVSILDMTKYTKQVAAYRIETNKLFDTTKRLADVSVGLGVDMGRIVLAYGQVRAASFLRAAEIRQFTEAGIPMLELLSEKLTRLNGELVTTEKVMDLVSKRGIDFKMVEEIFNDMTSAGGMFYNMQERQGNTLYGMWEKLGDAASMMYDDIGNTKVANWGIKNFIELATDMMRNWKASAAAGLGMAGVLSIVLARNKALATGTKQKEMADQRAAAATERRKLAEDRLHIAQTRGSADDVKAAQSSLAKAEADEKAAMAAQKKAQSTTAMSAGVKSVMGSIGSALGWGILIAALGTVVYKITEIITQSSKLRDELDNIRSETGVLQSQSVRNFEMLADKAVKAADGSKTQKDALDELQRTYKDMLPDEALKIENLRKMKGDYDSLTQSVREYIAAQQQQKALNTINEEEGAIQTKMQKKLRGVMMDKGLGELALSEEEIGRFWAKFEKTALDTTKSVKEQFVEAFRLAGLSGAEEMWDVVKSIGADWTDFNLFSKFVGKDNDLKYYSEHHAAIGKLSQSYERMDSTLKETAARYADLTNDLGEYTTFMQEYNGYVDKHMNSGETFLQNQENVNMQIKAMESMIRNGMKNAGLAWKEEWASLVDSVDPDDLNKLSTLNMEAIISAIDPAEHPGLLKYVKQFQKIYFDLVPQDTTVQQIRAKLMSIADSAGVSMDVMRRFLWNGSGDVDAHLKTLNEQINEYKASLKRMQTTYANNGLLGTISNFLMKGKIEETERIIKALEEQAKFVETYTMSKDKDKGGRKSDTRLQELQEINQTLSTINKEYDDLLKKEGNAKALADIKKQFKETLDYTNKIGAKFGLHFGFPTEFSTLQDYRHEILKVMESLKGLKGGEKAILQFQTMIDKADTDHFQKQVERELKSIAEQISRTRTAKGFFERILSQTGDTELALHLSTAIYGEGGQGLDAQIRRQVEALVAQTSATLDPAVFFADGSLDPKRLRAYVEAQKDALGGMEGKAYQELIKLSGDAEKDFAKTIEGWLKATEKAKGYSDKLLDIRLRTRRELDRIDSAQKQGRISKGFADSQRKGYLRKEAEEVAKLEYEAFKDSPMYTQMFDDLDHASTRMLENMRQRLASLQGEWKNLDPTQLKEMQSRLNEIDSQLAKRNPFKSLASAIRQYRSMRKSGDSRGNRSARDADNDLMKWATEAKAAEKAYREILSDDAATKEEIAVAKSRLDHAMSNEQAAQKAVESWKRVKDAIHLSAEELFSMMNWAGDIAHGVADVSEILGADEEDVQYWNDIAGAFDDIAGGIQDIVKAAMSGNVVGIISSTLTAIPKMFAGFSNLFYASRIRKANKEIRRQQELLDQLAYTYSRLEKLAEKAFGSDYISNFKEQQKNLEAQAAAYQKQADAEKGKGKKADKKKIKEYEEAYRETMDTIADMQGELATKMLGADLTSAARDFAQAWLEAYKEFANTSDKMGEKFRDMVENMMVEGALSRVMERALRPMFDMIDSMGEEDFYDQGFWKRVVEESQRGADAANTGAMTMMKFLEQAGIKVRDLGGELTGISREYANASEESIRGLAAVGNTQNFYLEQIRGEAQMIRRLIETGRTGTATETGNGYGELLEVQTRSMEHLSMIERNTAETVNECRRAARACEDQLRLLKAVVDQSGGSGKVRVRM